jgi:hypothetical protein
MWLPDLADATWVRDAVARHAEALELAGEVAGVELLDVRLTHPHRPGSPLCRGWATYVVTLSGAAPVQLYLKGFPDAATSEAAWLQDRAARPRGRSDHLAGDDVVVWQFPEDPSLPALPELLPPRLALADLPSAVADVVAPGSEPVEVVVVRYQPEASATLRLQPTGGGAGTAFAKHLAEGSVAAVARRHAALWAMTGAGSPLRVAEPLAADPPRNVLWTRGVPGRPLTAAVPPDELPEVAPVTGALLAALHGSAVEAPESVSLDATLAEMRKKAAKLAAGHAAVERVVGDLVARATRRRGEADPERARPLHGDFHLDQLVTSLEGPVLVDLDSMVTGPPEVDLAEFLVDLGLRGLPTPVAERVADRLVTSYRDNTGTEIDLAALEVCAEAEFLNRCYRHLRRHTPGWQDDLEEALARHADVAALVRG